MRLPQTILQALAIGLISCVAMQEPAWADDSVSAPILIGLNADMSASSAIGGEAIRRGAIIAIDEINRAGGVLGRPFTLTVRDHRGNPDRGIDNINDLASNEDLVAVIGGVHTPVAMAELETVHEHGIVYLGPWAAGALVVDHSYEPNFVFRVSVRDAYAGEFLIDAALERGYRHPAFLLWQTTWGRSNEVAMRTALESRGKQPAAIEWFNTGAKSVTKQLEAIKRAGADVVMLIAEPNGAATAVRDMAVLAPEERLAIIADWGLTAGEFHRDVRDDLSAVDLKFLQTFTFFDPPFPDRANRVLAAYCNHFGDCDGPVSVRAPTGFAHAYDLVYLLARAIEAAGTVERSQVRQALERLKRHAGLVRLYQPPFTPTDHDALAPDDYRLAAYDENGVIVPLDF